jgi:hypothetical protein
MLVRKSASLGWKRIFTFSRALKGEYGLKIRLQLIPRCNLLQPRERTIERENVDISKDGVKMILQHLNAGARVEFAGARLFVTAGTFGWSVGRSVFDYRFPPIRHGSFSVVSMRMLSHCTVAFLLSCVFIVY